MSNREEIRKLVKGELTYTEAYELENRLHSRTDLEIIQDLKALPFKSLLDTEEALDDYLNTNEVTIESCKRSLEFLEIAISERVEEMLNAEKKLKDILWD